MRSGKIETDRIVIRVLNVHDLGGQSGVCRYVGVIGFFRFGVVKIQRRKGNRFLFRSAAHFNAQFVIAQYRKNKLVVFLIHQVERSSFGVAKLLSRCQNTFQQNIHILFRGKRYTDIKQAIQFFRR